MDALRLRSTLRRHFAWLLWLALLFPVAQAAAGAHAISHARQEACRAGIDACANQSACELCLLAAAIAAGAPACDPPAVALPELGHERPATVDVAAPDGKFDPGYRSRAPPSTPR